MRGLLRVAAFSTVALFSACGDEPTYDLSIRLAETRDGGAHIERELRENTASLKNFPCEVSIRLGQCVDARPLQMVFLKGDQNQARQTCGGDSVRAFLQDNVGKTITLGRGTDGGQLWIQAFLGDDDDDSSFVDPEERAAYAELVRGTMNLTTFDDDRMEATIDATDQNAADFSFVKGDLGAAVNDDGNRFAVGPRCTWPIMAEAD